MSENFKTSEKCGHLMFALTKVREDLGFLEKTGINPHFNSGHVELPELLEKAVPCMAKHGIGFLQACTGLAGVTTLIEHIESGQWVKQTSYIDPGKAGAHGAMGGVTYQKRYQLAALLGIPERDDDGNSATPKNSTKTTNKSTNYNPPKNDFF